jgi:hypothetical protein
MRRESQYQRRIRTGLTLFTKYKLTVCICPLCGKRHKLRMYWRGRGAPRKYCADCLNLSVVHSSLEDHSILVKKREYMGELSEYQDSVILEDFKSSGNEY